MTEATVTCAEASSAAMCDRHSDHYAPCSACKGFPCCAAGRLHRLALDMVDDGDASDVDAALAQVRSALGPRRGHVTVNVVTSVGGPGSSPPGVPIGMVQEAYRAGRRRRL